MQAFKKMTERILAKSGSRCDESERRNSQETDYNNHSGSVGGYQAFKLDSGAQAMLLRNNSKLTDSSIGQGEFTPGFALQLQARNKMEHITIEGEERSFDSSQQKQQQ